MLIGLDRLGVASATDALFRNLWGMRFLRFREKVKRKASAPTKSIDPVRDESCYDLPSAVPLFLLSLIDNPFVQTQQSAGPDNGACRPHLLCYGTPRHLFRHGCSQGDKHPAHRTASHQPAAL